MANLQKTYTISIELDEAQKKLADAAKQLDVLKTKTAEANTEAKESKAVYQENARALLALEKAERALEKARIDASGKGADFFKAKNALEANIAAQAQLRKQVEESRIAYEDAATAAQTANSEQAKQVGVVREISASVKELKEEIKENPPAPLAGTLGALRHEAKALEAALDDALDGSAEQEALIRQLGEVKARLKDVDEAVDVAFDRDRAGALMDAVSGVAGAFEVAFVAAEQFGLSSQTAQEYQKSLTSLIGVVQGLEQVHKLTTSEVRTALKNAYSDTKRVVLGYLGIGEAATASGTAASTAGKVTKAALISTGIGLLIVLVGVLVANWDRLIASVSGGEKVFTKVKAVVSGVLSSMGAAIVQTGKLLADFFTGDVVSLVADANAFGKAVGNAYDKGFSESIKDSNRKFIDQQNEARKRRIDILEAQGKDVRALRIRQLSEEIQNMKVDSEESQKALQDKYTELRKLEEGYYKDRREAAQANDLAELQAEITQRQARGEAVLQLTLRQKEQELVQLLNATQLNEAAITAKMAEVEAARIAIGKDAADKANALRLAQLNRQVAIEQAFGRDATAAIMRVKEEELRQLLTAAQRNAAAILAKETEIMLVRVAKAKELGKLYGFSLEEIIRRQGEKEQKLHDELGAKIIAGTKAKTDQLAAEAAARAKIGIPVGLYDTILIKLFGVAPDQLEATKEIIAEAAMSLSQSINIISSTLLDAAYVNVQKRLDAAQLQYDEVSKKLDDAIQSRQSAESQLAAATGARRDFLLKKIESERSAEERLAKAKAKAAADEQRALKEKMELDRQAAKISAASALASNIASSAKIIETGYNLVSGAAKMPFPASLVAVVGAVAALASITLQVRNLAKMENGGDLPGGVVEGPSHAQGGVRGRGAFANIEVEGGEKIVNKRATANNRAALHMINTVGRTRTLLPDDFARAASYRVLPAPQRQFANGGDLPVPGNSATTNAQTIADEIKIGELEAKIDQTNALLRILVAYGPAQLNIGPSEGKAIVGQAEVYDTAGNPVRL